VPGYSTITGENASTVTMAAGTSLFRKLLSIGSGYTVTGWDLDVHYGDEASTASTGLTTGVPFADRQLKWALSYGATTFSPPALIGNADAAGILWYTAGEDFSEYFIVSASSTWQSTFSWRARISARYQFRLAAGSDFCFQIGNNSSVSIPFGFTATLRVSYA
jgi:hypothetical protein